jgi:hypothetical protein
MTYFTWRDFLDDLMPEDVVVGVLLVVAIVCMGFLFVGFN